MNGKKKPLTDVVMVYEVQTWFYGDTWENVWQEDDKILTFANLNAAIDAIRDHIIDCINAVESGYMSDSPAQDAFRIICGSKLYEWSGNGWRYERRRYNVNDERPSDVD